MLSAPIYVGRSPDGTILFLKDGDGRMSMTNDAEAVVRLWHDQAPGLRVVYKDTNGAWDEMVHDFNGRFLKFKPYDGARPHEEED